jgi:hypothetical protein
VRRRSDRDHFRPYIFKQLFYLFARDYNEKCPPGFQLGMAMALNLWRPDKDERESAFMIDKTLLKIRKEYNKAYDAFMCGKMTHEEWVRIERSLTKATSKIRSVLEMNEQRECIKRQAPLVLK